MLRVNAQVERKVLNLIIKPSAPPELKIKAMLTIKLEVKLELNAKLADIPILNKHAWEPTAT